jgi:hypothetical protein
VGGEDEVTAAFGGLARHVHDDHLPPLQQAGRGVWAGGRPGQDRAGQGRAGHA